MHWGDWHHKALLIAAFALLGLSLFLLRVDYNALTAVWR